MTWPPRPTMTTVAVDPAFSSTSRPCKCAFPPNLPVCPRSGVCGGAFDTTAGRPTSQPRTHLALQLSDDSGVCVLKRGSHDVLQVRVCRRRVGLECPQQDGVQLGSQPLCGLFTAVAVVHARIDHADGLVVVQSLAVLLQEALY
ncbi:hypothetical protein FOA52_006988 [Chlamydomonas sp. UWO 241]|nr:hypothetical protein FOA52_006988 [Chlamydomonas sp. UWO 241]